MVACDYTIATSLYGELHWPSWNDAFQGLKVHNPRSPNIDSVSAGLLQSEFNLLLLGPFSYRGPLEAYWELRMCILKHDCAKHQTADLPTRLLDLEVTDPDKIKLALTKNISRWKKYTERIRYAALSYCWGKNNNNTLKTTPSTLKQHLSAIQIADLPRTLRETIWAARDLGIRYLWIDALCILQRDGNISNNKEADADWQYESAHMNLVYGNALFTFVAAAAANSEEGLFRDEYRYMYWNHAWPHCDYGTVPISKASISGRAWALQEWTLSSRRLVFTKFGIQFICDDTNDNGNCGVRINLVTQPEYMRESWPLLVSNYCSRDLTNPRDKLPAFSGLAQEYAKRCKLSKKDYLAGLWRHWLPNHLLWHRQPRPSAYHPSRYGNRVAGNSVRQPGRAPTWSWASVDGNVNFQKEIDLCPSLEVKACQVELADGDDFFGQVKRGVLEITCLYSTTSSYGKRSLGSGDLFVDYIVGCILMPDVASELKELMSIATPRPELYYLQLGIVEALYSQNETWGLIVRFDEKELAFVRIGVFRCPTKYFHPSSRKDFKIV